MFLAANPDIQKRAQKEIDENIGKYYTWIFILLNLMFWSTQCKLWSKFFTFLLAQMTFLSAQIFAQILPHAQYLVKYDTKNWAGKNHGYFWVHILYYHLIRHQ